MCTNRPILQLTTEVQTIYVTGRIGCLDAQPRSAFGEAGFTSLPSGVESSSGAATPPGCSLLGTASIRCWMGVG